MPRLTTTFGFALQGIRSHPYESALMALTLGVIFGASLVAVSLTKSARREMEESLRRMGEDLIHVHRDPTPGALIRGAGTGLVAEEANVLGRSVGGEGTAARVSLTVVEAGGKPQSTVLLATDSSWASVTRSDLEAGRFFRAGETNACVLDSGLARSLFRKEESPIGRRVGIAWAGRRADLRVCGVLADPLRMRDKLQGLDFLSAARPLVFRILEGRCAYVPIEIEGPAKEVQLILVRHAEGMDPWDARATIRESLGEKGESLIVWPRKPWIDSLLGMMEIGQAFSNVVWIIFVVLAGAMVMTISLLSLQGRTVEIGVRRAVGATRVGVCVQIVLEGTILGVIGAALGIAATPPTGTWISRNLPFSMTLRWEDVLLVVGSGLALVALSFLVPATRAGRMDPVEVLREL